MRSYPKKRSLEAGLRFFVWLSSATEFQAKPSGILGVNHIVRRFPARFELSFDIWREIVNLDELSLTWVG